MGQADENQGLPQPLLKSKTELWCLPWNLSALAAALSSRLCSPRKLRLMEPCVSDSVPAFLMGPWGGFWVTVPGLPQLWQDVPPSPLFMPRLRPEHGEGASSGRVVCSPLPYPGLLWSMFPWSLLFHRVMGVNSSSTQTKWCFWIKECATQEA